MKKNNAFTLAEVLVTLIILGVIASMTIPGLKKTSDEKVFVATLLKAQSQLTQATKTLKRTEGPIAMWTDYSNAENAPEQIINIYKKIMPPASILSKSYTINPLVSSESKNTGSSDDKNNNSNSSKGKDQDSEEQQAFTEIPNDNRTIMTADGIGYTLASVNNCTAANAASKNCFRFVVDVNGSKEPNMVGVDVYAFDVMKNSDVIPVMGTCPPAGGSDYGWGCTSRAIAEKDISW